MFLMEYPSITGEDLLDYAEKAIWNILHAYIDAHNQRLIDKYPRYVFQAITGLQ